LNRHSPERIVYLKRLQEAHPDDFWINHELGVNLAHVGKPEEGVGYLRVALAARPSAAGVHNNLGVALVQSGREEDEALRHLRQAVELAPRVGGFHYALGAALCRLGRHDEAIEELQVALRLGVNAAVLHQALARSLEAKGRPAEALAEYGRAVALDPKNTDYQEDLRSFFMRQGRPEEARAAWAEALATTPAEHAAWYGYAEFCLFLGHEDEYHRARQALLAQFGTATDPYVAERTARACLLLSAPGDELCQAVTLAERAVGVDPSKYPGVYPYFLFAQGLAEYRQERWERTISLMRGKASQVFGPAPRLVLAMALHQSGQVDEARKTLAAAIRAHDWSAEKVGNQDDWIYHVLRREAERLVQADLPEFPEGP
jgi:serine/threonine-protein kinase